MIRRIDFLGSSGVGKSTLYNELVKSRTKEDGWLTPIEAKVKLAQIYLNRRNKKFSDYVVTIFLNYLIFKKIHDPLSNIVLEKYGDSLSWNDKEAIAFDKMIKAIASSSFSPEIKLFRLGWLLETAKDVAFLKGFETVNANMTVFFDESLTQKLINIGPWNSLDENSKLDDVCNVVGSVSAVIFLDADDNTVLKRLKQRRNIRENLAHKKMTESEIIRDTKLRLNSARQLADLLESRGIRIIRVNAEEPIPDQITLLREALDKLPLSHYE
jgi:hypothetical protein